MGNIINLNDYPSAPTINLNDYQSPPSYADGASPDTPINSSPVSLTDRAALSLGNTSGNIKYLKQTYEDVKPDKDGSLIVKDKGIWHRVDPKTLQEPDAWSTTRNLIQKIPGLAGGALTAVGGTLGGTLGASTTLGAGTVMGVGAGAAAGEALRTSLGRLVGTYEATPEEQVKDIAVESFLNMAGHKIALGVQPQLSKISKIVTQFVKDAAPGVRQIMAKVLSATTGVDLENMNRVLGERAVHIMNMVRTASRSAGDEAADSVLKRTNIVSVKSLLEGSQKALSAQFDTKEKELLSQVPESFTLDVGATINSAMSELQKLGIVSPNEISQSGKILSYKMLPVEKLMDYLKHPEGSGALSAQAVGSLQNLVKLGNTFAKNGTQQGAEAVQSLLNIRRGFDNFYMTTIKANPDIIKILTPASSAIRKSLVESIGKVSPEVASSYAQMNNFYRSKMPFVAKAERIIHNFNMPESFVNQLSQPAGDSELNKQVVKEIASLKGEIGQQLLDRLKDGLAANDFLRVMPKVNLKHAAIGVGAGIATGHGGLVAAGTLMASPAMSPRIVGNTSALAHSVLPYMEHLGDSVKQMVPEQLKQLIQSPATVDTLYRTVLDSAFQEKQNSEQLLQQAGVK